MQQSQLSKVTVIVAIYNVERFVEKCIQSIISQDYVNLEIILVDDCSTDSSGAICDKYAAGDERIIVIHNLSNQKQSRVRNAGMDRAAGDYIAFVDGDDWLASDFVSYMLRIIEETNTNMSISLNNFSTRDNKQVAEDRIEIWSAEKTVTELLMPTITIGCWNKIYRRDYLKKHDIRFDEEVSTGEGDVFISATAQRAEKVGIGRRKVYYYRMNNINSATTKPDVKRGIEAIKSLEIIERNLIIRTEPVMLAWGHHMWKNHFWVLCLILLTHAKKENYLLYQNSISYIKTNAAQVTKATNSLVKKMKWRLTGVAPVMMARLVNCRFVLRLRLDLYKNQRNEL
jgi:glycosyltransferase involved in cell wall biosynthesis